MADTATSSPIGETQTRVEEIARALLAALAAANDMAVHSKDSLDAAARQTLELRNFDASDMLDGLDGVYALLRTPECDDEQDPSKGFTVAALQASRLRDALRDLRATARQSGFEGVDPAPIEPHEERVPNAVAGPVLQPEIAAMKERLAALEEAVKNAPPLPGQPKIASGNTLQVGLVNFGDISLKIDLAEALVKAATVAVNAVRRVLKSAAKKADRVGEEAEKIGAKSVAARAKELSTTAQSGAAKANKLSKKPEAEPPTPPPPPSDTPKAYSPEMQSAFEAVLKGQPPWARTFVLDVPSVKKWPEVQMIAIPPGRFMMGGPPTEERWHGYDGREEPQTPVQIDYAFALGQHAVTLDAFKAFVAETNHDTGKSAVVWNGKEWKDTPGKGWRDPGFAQAGNNPVCCVNWNDAKAFTAWLNKKLGLTGRPDAYRLPSEAEWEYACRAGTDTPFSFGQTINTDQANYDGNYSYGAGKKTGVYHRKTMPVGSFLANPFGLHEMHGNVWEWSEDTFQKNYEGAPRDGSPWVGTDSSSRVLRGGSWDVSPSWLRSAGRSDGFPSYRDNDWGFRLARSAPGN
jgi:formylglycine-generating enzyme required for sulfatase activity